MFLIIIFVASFLPSSSLEYMNIPPILKIFLFSTVLNLEEGPKFYYSSSNVSFSSILSHTFLYGGGLKKSLNHMSESPGYRFLELSVIKLWANHKLSAPQFSFFICKMKESDLLYDFLSQGAHLDFRFLHDCPWLLAQFRTQWLFNSP